MSLADDDNYDDGDPDGIPPGGEFEEDRDWEAEARAMGWHPLAGPGVSADDAYKGPPDQWMDAREYVETSEHSVPIMRAQLRRTTGRLTKAAEQIDGLTNTVAEQAAAIAELRAIARNANDAGYNRAKAEIEADKREAVENADREAYDQAVEREKALETERAKAAPPPTPPAGPGPDRAIVDWEKQNSTWWNKDADLSRAMIAHHEIIKAKHPAMPLVEQLAMATEKLKEDFPAKFGIRPAPPPLADDEDEEPAPMARRPASQALNPTRTPIGSQRRRNASPFDSIQDPTEKAQAQAAFERIRRSSPDYTAEEYMAVYDDPHADVLALRKRKST